MEVLVCGGFLGSGKTTLINKLLHGITQAGMTAALIENEVCEQGIDAALTEQKGIRIIPLFGGCVCCQLSGDLLTTVQALEEEVHPDWAVVEMTGLAMMGPIRTVFAQYGRPGLADSLHTLTVVDMARFNETFLTRMEPVIRSQLSGADVAVVNKTDVAPLTGSVLDKLRDMAPQAVILPMSAAALSPDEVWTTVREAMS